MRLKITVHGVAYEVDVEVLDAADEMQGNPPPVPTPAPRTAPAGSPAAPSGAAPPSPPTLTSAPLPKGGGGVASPIAGVVLEVKCKVGATVQRGEVLMLIEAMKMETAIAAPTAGTVRAIHAAAGDAVRENQILVDLAN